MTGTVIKNKFLIRIAVLLSVSVVVYFSINNLRSFFSSKSPSTYSSNEKIIAIGNNNNGQLGISPNDQASGVHTIENPSDVAEIATGRNFSAARTGSGKVYLWGGNDWGQLGFKTDLIRQDTPYENKELSGVKRIALSNNHALALKNDGTVWSFGSNFSGQLGTGDNIDQKTPVRVKNIDDIATIAAGYKFSVAVKNDGTVWAWGASCDSSQKRDSELWWKNVMGNMTNLEGGYYDPNSDALATYDKNEYCINEDVVGILSKVPIEMENLKDIIYVSAGYGHVLALTNDGAVWSFGCDSYKQLGREIKNKSDAATPARINALLDISEVAAGYRHSLALAKDGTLWGWGENSHGQLGDGTTENRKDPIKINVDHVTQIVAGYDYSLVLKDDGTVWGWGRNVSQWFGDSTVEFVTEPVQIKELSHVTQLASGGAHILVLEGGNEGL